MALPEHKQAHNIIERSTSIMLIVPQRATLDAIASMMALYIALQNIKEAGIDQVSPQHVPPALQFLGGSSQVAMQPNTESNITVDIAGPTTISGVRTTPLQGGIRIHLALPLQSVTTKDQIEVSIRAMPYDLIITLGATDLEEIGTIYFDHTDYFYNTPIINIDHRASNEHFGTINIVDITAGSVAEVVYELINNMQLPVDQAIATALYAGLVAGTESFQRPSTTPRSFQVAARLMEADADRESVIQHLVKTKPLNLLKLAGRLYARLRYDKHLQLFWSIVRPIDFQESGATPPDLPAALYELANNISGFNAAFVLTQRDNHTFEAHILLGKGLHHRRREIQEQLTAERQDSILYFKFSAPSLEEAEQITLDRIKTILP